MEGKNQLHARVIIEVLGKPKEHIEQTIHGYVKKIKDEKIVEVVNEEYADAVEKDGMWTMFVELEIKSIIQDLIAFCFDYMPSSVEIIEPEHIQFSNGDLSNFLNDLQHKLHEVDMKVKYLNTEHNFLKKNTAVMLRNLVSILLSNHERDLTELSKLTGIGEKELGEFMGQLEQKNIVSKKEEKYTLREGENETRNKTVALNASN
jgi:hypothetical protein